MDDLDERAIILTAQFDAKTQDFFEAHRRRHFPPTLNKIPAHLTLFHNLPGAEEQSVIKAIGQASPAAPMPANVAGVMKLGKGTAFRVESEGLLSFRSSLLKSFDGWLRGQDRQKFRPHVTIQNKVTPRKAAILFEHLSAEFQPFIARIEGVQVWRYDGGPWEPRGAIAFDRR
ncbi:MAG: 2'-5' RNA ligase family protein [Pseudomonadota bacterium]